MSDDLAAAVEHHARAVFAYRNGASLLWHDAPAFTRSQYRQEAANAIEAARPLLPETRAVQRVRALAEDWPCCDETCDGDCTGCAYGRDLLRALEGDTPNDDERAQ